LRRKKWWLRKIVLRSQRKHQLFLIKNRRKIIKRVEIVKQHYRNLKREE